MLFWFQGIVGSCLLKQYSPTLQASPSTAEQRGGTIGRA